MRIAVVGHVEHVTLGHVVGVPRAGEIVHLTGPRILAGGGGAIAFHQLVRSDAELHLFTALGDGEAGTFVERELARTGANVHAARREEPHTRVLVMISPGGERTIVVVGQPQQPTLADALPWETFARCDAVYFTAQDPELLRATRQARVLVVAARRREAIARAGVRADVVVGSAADAREASRRADFDTLTVPGALILTEGPSGGTIATAAGETRFATPRRAHDAPLRGSGTYGAGDSFAGALTYYFAAGYPIDDACARAAAHGAAVIGGSCPIDVQAALDAGR
jgi:ribokinase